MPHRIQLLIIDPQNDFCDVPPSWMAPCPLTHPPQPITPALPVRGAHADMQRLATLIRTHKNAISDMVLTLDSHQRIDIAHPPFWEQADGSAVQPWTTICAQQVRDGLFRPRLSDALPRVLNYLDALEAQGRYALMVWPIHCEIGTWGHNVHADVHNACAIWAQCHQRGITYVHKGMNPWTEHYSALQAEVPDVQDPHTALNHALIARLDAAQTIWVAGQASSHCVKATVEHLVAHLPSQQAQKIVLLSDCMSAVTGFEPHAQAFFDAMQARGVRLTHSTAL